MHYRVSEPRSEGHNWRQNLKVKNWYLTETMEDSVTRYNHMKHAAMDPILQLPGPPSGPKNLFPWLLGVLPADNPQLTALSRNCPWLKRTASSKVIQPASNNWLMWGSEVLTPSPQFWKTIPAPKLWWSLLSICLECYHRPASLSA